MAPIATENPAAALREMKQDWQKNTGQHLEDDLLQLQETGLVKKQTVAEKKKQLRETTKKCEGD